MAQKEPSAPPATRRPPPPPKPPTRSELPTNFAQFPPDTQERRDFEQWYVTHAFDYASNPIGSRDCGLQWSAWLARSTGNYTTPNAQGQRAAEPSAAPQSWTPDR